MSPPTQDPSLLDRLRRFDPTVLPILVAAVVLVGAVAWLLYRPLPAPVATQDPRLEEALATARADRERIAALTTRLAALEGTAQRLAALEARPAPDLAPLRQAIAAAAGSAEAVERRIAALEGRPAVDPQSFAPRAALEQLAPRVEALATQAGQLSGRLDALAQQQQQAGNAAGQLSGRLDALTQQQQQAATAAEQARTALAGRIAAAEAGLAARAQAQEAQGSRIGAVEQGLNARIAALETQLAQRAETIAQQATRIAALEIVASRLPALEARAARLAALDAARAALDAGRPLGRIEGAPEPLARFATAAPPTEAQLRLAFEDAARAARAASEPPPGGGVLDSAVSRLSGLVTVRRGEEVVWGDAAAAEIERARRALEAGDLAGALSILQKLPPAAQEAMRGWTSQAEALLAARAALRQMAAG